MRFEAPIKTPGASIAAATAALLIAQQVAGKAVRDALFLSAFSAAYLPYVMAAGATLSLGAVHWLSKQVTRHSPAAIVPFLFFCSACGLVVEWMLSEHYPRAAGVAVYLHTALFGPTTVSTFWSLVNERFDPHAAKRAVARIGAGATLGGVLGGLAAWRASSLVQPRTVLLFLAAVNLAATGGVLALRASAPPASRGAQHLDSQESVWSSLQGLGRAPFLRNLAILVAIGAASSTLLDYVFSAQASAVYSGPALLSFFSMFWLAVGVGSLVLQLTLGRVALEKLGLAVNIAILPGIIILGGAFGLAMPGLPSASLLRGAEAVQRNTLFRSAYEVLYTPLPEERKRATKALIDVGFDRFGTVVGSGILVVMLHLALRRPEPALLAGVVVLAFATLPVARQLHVGYVAALQEGLRHGAAKLKVADVSGGFEVVTLPPERDDLVERIEKLQPGGLTALVEHRDLADLPTVRAHAESFVLAKLCVDLLAEDPAASRAALERVDSRGPAASCAIRLLAHPELHHDALRTLRAIAPQIVGELIDDLLDDANDFVLRRRIPRVLTSCATQRAVDGLILGIADPRFEVRYECGRALMQITDQNHSLVVSRAKVIEAIRREIELEKSVLLSHGPEFDEHLHREESAPMVDMLIRDRVDRSLEHVFTILSLQLEREPLRIAFAALHHEDVRYRGTALEYLDTVLPGELRDIVWPFLGASAPLPTARPLHEILEGLAAAVKRS